MPAQGERFRTFKAFYPFYLQEHANVVCRRLHFIGSTLVLFILAMAIIRGNYALLWLMPIAGYGFAWVGHYFFEHNRPATFTYPFYSFIGDWAMYRDILAGRIRW